MNRMLTVTINFALLQFTHVQWIIICNRHQKGTKQVLSTELVAVHELVKVGQKQSSCQTVCVIVVWHASTYFQFFSVDLGIMGVHKIPLVYNNGMHVDTISNSANVCVRCPSIRCNVGTGKDMTFS